jgi:hypothetical protein
MARREDIEYEGSDSFRSDSIPAKYLGQDQFDIPGSSGNPTSHFRLQEKYLPGREEGFSDKNLNDSQVSKGKREQGEELEDLSPEEEKSLVKEGSKDSVVLYIHTSRKARKRMNQEQFNYLWEMLQQHALEQLEAGNSIPFSIVNKGYIKGRGFLECQDEASAKFVEGFVCHLKMTRADNAIEYFGSWRKDSAGTKLVLAFLKDETMSVERVRKFILLSNGLKNISCLRLGEVSDNKTRTATFRVSGGDLKILRKLREEKKQLRVGLIECHFTIRE